MRKRLNYKRMAEDLVRRLQEGLLPELMEMTGPAKEKLAGVLAEAMTEAANDEQGRCKQMARKLLDSL